VRWDCLGEQGAGGYLAAQSIKWLLGCFEMMGSPLFVTVSIKNLELLFSFQNIKNQLGFDPVEAHCALVKYKNWLNL